ncbi:hypothetical protein NBRC3257_3134 [Gluconobacter thailandicus NBRC 3257]|uniref:Uncharacterized protein n=1 Tax=Gluconobacter thailandicus NBRC 3257 TaxID=1381097 RepID=A0ABQ0J0Z1_GLUTH|nr:hypothetical protein NBRC3255_2731 [Gluconobacter thailandicus NBRC 3255]GAD28135.1 hypothetical protein NBRC3257_3134 [Gluconobacter thailandicus NBRC 3257]
MLHPWPTPADRIQDHLGTGTVGDVGRGHPAPLLWRPHPELESHQIDFPNRL